VTTQDGVVAGQGTEAETEGGAAGEAAVQDESGASAGADVPGGEQMPLSQPAEEQNKTETQS